MFFARERARPVASARSVRPYASTIATGIASLRDSAGEKHQAQKGVDQEMPYTGVGPLRVALAPMTPMVGIPGKK
jgi:hypothetical protein